VADEVREEHVAALLMGQPVDANGAERALARSAAVTAATLWQRDSLLPTGRKIEDATLREFVGIAAAYGELARWWPQPVYRGKNQGPKLSDVLKVVPEDVAETVRYWLTWAGHMADPDARLRRIDGLLLEQREDDS
jgi:hypothetical protein